MCSGDDRNCPEFETHRAQLLADLDAERRSFLKGAFAASGGMAALSASGGCVLALAQSLALGGAPIGVRVNTICYGLLAPSERAAPEEQMRAAVRRIPLGRATSPADVVDAIMFLLSPDASYLTGSTLVVDGGQSLQSWSNAPDAPGYPQPD